MHYLFNMHYILSSFSVWNKQTNMQKSSQASSYISASNASLVQKHVFCPQSGVCEALVRKTWCWVCQEREAVCVCVCALHASPTVLII